MASENSLTDRLYEAALVPELWAETCEMLASTVAADSSTIFTVDHHGSHRYVTTPNFAEGFEAFARSEHRLNNVRATRALERSPFSFARDIDILTPEEYAADPIRPLYLEPHGLKWEAGYLFQEPSGHTIAIVLGRGPGRAHFSDAELATLDGLKPDIARAAYMSSRLSFMAARSMTEALSMLGLPAAVVGEGGQALAMNREMEILSPRIRSGAADRIILDTPGAQSLLNDALQRYRDRAVPVVQSLPMPPRQGTPPLILHLLPVRRAARDIFSRAAAVLAVTEVGQVGPPDLRVLCGLFDLTPAQARVARALAMAQTPEMVAASLGISLETARSHLKKIMQKTGTTRQAELVLLLSGLRVPVAGGAGMP